MVIKIHELNERKKFYTDPCKERNFLSPPQDFEMAVTSYRDPFDAMCSNIHVLPENTHRLRLCERTMYDQYAVFKSLNVVYEMNFEDLKDGHILQILRDLAERLNLLESLSRIAMRSDISVDKIFELIRIELSSITSPPTQVAGKKWSGFHHPVTLMHPNHRRKQSDIEKKDDPCLSNPMLEAMHRNPLCVDLAAQGGRMSNALWDKHRSRWDDLKKSKIPIYLRR